MPEVTIEPDGIKAQSEEGETVLRALGRAGLRYRVGAGAEAAASARCS